ncbi:hypothetical protein ACIHJG_24750 [Streptomyces sp. NPDC052415]|uniref:hypothetical protein n=1 Tax=unclassified Streptomyces TaxID=2593676 RepID=UPI0020224F59|nr:hypothetical protein [Streptomyces sp. YS415]MCL7427750.1 hypothetical protein [Streptomyces sp. YS415]
MPTTSLPRRAGARAAALAALTLAGTAVGAPAALAQPAGDTGDIKIHKVGTPLDDQRDEPQVCDFYLAALNFAPSEVVTWTVKTQPPITGGGQLPNASYPDNTVTVGQTRSAQTIPLALPNGQYKLTWKTNLGHGVGKQKLFNVNCPVSKPTAPPVPNGGPPAGGGGMARDDAFAPVAGAAAVGLAAVSGVVWFRLRRRPHGA